MKRHAPLLLSFNGGYVDTAGFLVLQGLFTAHITGNFVTLGMTIALGTSGAVAKLLALPVFCLVLILSRLLGLGLKALGLPVLRIMFLLMAILLAAGAALAVRWGPFADGDSWRALATGMVLVSAMAIQNGAHRLHLPKVPPSTLMTGNSTQIMLDIGDLLAGGLQPAARQEVRDRMTRMASIVGSFAAGCAVATAAFMAAGMYVFVLPPLVAVAAFVLVHPEDVPVHG